MYDNLKARIYFGLKKLNRSHFENHLRWFQENQFKSFETLKEHRDALLLRLLEEAYQWVPAYRQRMEEAGVYVTGQISLTKFHELPVLDREELIFNGEKFNHLRANERKPYTFPTGGSTGCPVQITQDRHYRDWSWASTSLFYEWSGLSIGTPYFFLWAAAWDIDAVARSWKERFLVSYLQGRRTLNCIVTSPEILTGFIERINREKDCNYLVGYANELYSLACHSEDTGVRINRPFKAVYSTAACLTEAMREKIQSVFRAPVYNRFGCRDAGDIACECPYQNGLHINPLYTYVEIADEAGNPLPYGQEGQVLITALHNYSMPLIRYALGDEGVLRGPEPCLCGRNWETLQGITGRMNEKLYLPDGKKFGVTYLVTIFEHLPFVNRYQVHQHDLDRVVVKLRTPVPNYIETYGPELEEATRLFYVCTGYRFKVTYEQTDAFDRTLTGKEPVVVQKMENQSLALSTGRHVE